MNKRKLGSFALCAMLLALCASAEAQQPKKVPQMGTYRRSIRLVSPPVPREFGWLCASLAT
jgi:hypothetical protein